MNYCYTTVSHVIYEDVFEKPAKKEYLEIIRKPLRSEPLKRRTKKPLSLFSEKKRSYIA